MEINDAARTRLNRSLERTLERINLSFTAFMNDIDLAKDVNVLTRLKRDLLLDLIKSLPLNVDECYFCLLSMEKKREGRLDCSSCQYARDHGKCTDSSSDFARISGAHKTLQHLVRDTYHKVPELMHLYKKRLCPHCSNRMIAFEGEQRCCNCGFAYY